EGKDRRLEKGDYYRSDQDWEELRSLTSVGLPIVLLLNAGGPIELAGLLDVATHIEAVVQISQPGQQGGEAVADVLLGKVTPEGKLTATWARRYSDYPEADHFGILSGDLTKSVYREGIYVGYRYFDSFGVKPLFPFGYGLSYTSFEIQATGLYSPEPWK
ncbi:MAG: glycoside hydrolase family 3 protein, partial [Dysosmobacter welbionis]